MSETGLVQREWHSAGGNGALLVVIDSGGPYWERSIVDETVLVALEHFGFPYRLLDLAKERPTPEGLNGCAGIVLAQNGLGERLSAAETGRIADAVRNGVGLVNFDYDLRLYSAPLLEMFGFEGINPHPYATNSVRVREGEHDITGMQAGGEFHAFDRMVTGIAVERWREDVTPLADGILGKDQLVYIRHLAPWSAFEPRNFPFLFAGRWGKGRAVQFTLNQRVWRNAFFGHARGMDDLFWRSILWAVRKPFVANLIPPFVTLSMDDCKGRHDFAYADIASAHGYRMMPSLMIREVPERLFPRVREGLKGGKIHYNAHALDYYTLLVYDFGKGECSAEDLKERFGFMDAWWKRVGAQPGTTLRLHWGEYGVKSLPLWKARGHRFLCPTLQMGLHKADMCMLDGFWPYNLQTCYYDYVPDDHDFFAFAAMSARHQEDFLTGCTAYLKESERNDVEKAARNAARCIQNGLRGGFYAEVVTHEQKFDALSPGEWDQILRRAGELTEGYEKIHASHDEIGAYLKGKDGVWIREVHAEGGQLRATLAGKTETGLRLSVFRDEGDAVRREYRAVEAFEGHAEIG
ncbi:MAG: hypothetical protein EXS64_01695 [Candidatus Latescibacteria bacterium]|nr:hypothetical protein [Candidatus Latescibacterota bacterium]